MDLAGEETIKRKAKRRELSREISMDTAGTDTAMVNVADGAQATPFKPWRAAKSQIAIG
jgi:hypothetical protein